MKKAGKIFFVLLGILLCMPSFSQTTTTNYAKTGMNLTMNLEWTSENYGNIQWQKSTNNGSTWSDISGATSSSYAFTISGDALYRVKVNGDEACDPFLMQHTIKVVSFDVSLESQSDTSALFQVSNANFRGAKIVDYGFCVALYAMGRAYTDMKRISIGTNLTDTTNFEMKCPGLLPNLQYIIRTYFRTSDGSLIFGPGKICTTLGGLSWHSEDWQIEENQVVAKFELDGVTSGISNIQFMIGKDDRSLSSVNVTKASDSYVYTTDTIRGLDAGTSYIAYAKVMIDGDEQIISKSIKTLTDYSNYTIDNTVKDVSHKIIWNTDGGLHSLSPSTLMTEYPRMLRVNADTILLVYHGGATDWWQNIYLSKSYDNGTTWSQPIVLIDNSKSFYGSSYYRFCNPELIKLQNGWILMPFIGNGNPETNNNCKVMTLISKDCGETWSDPIIVGRGRTWEPMIIQLPGGELELYVSSEAAWWTGSALSSNQQQILFSRSTDNGLTWTAFERACYYPNRRDGMPCAVCLQGNKGIIFSIESINNSTSPYIVKRDLNGKWNATAWNGVEDNNRWSVPMAANGGAPYMIQLPTGEVVVSCHADTYGSVWQTGRPRIMIGDNTGHNFGQRTLPLATSGLLSNGEGAYYNSLFLKDMNTIWLLTTHCVYNGTTRLSSNVEYLEGTIVNK